MRGPFAQIKSYLETTVAVGKHSVATVRVIDVLSGRRDDQGDQLKFRTYLFLDGRPVFSTDGDVFDSTSPVALPFGEPRPATDEEKRLLRVAHYGLRDQSGQLVTAAG